MKPSPQSQRFIYENQTPSAISDQKQQPSGQGYQGRTGKAINCQSLHRSTSQSTTAPTPTPNPQPPHPHPCLPLPTDTHAYGSSAFYCKVDTRTGILLLKPSTFRALHDGNIWSSLSLLCFRPDYLSNDLESRLQDQHSVQFR